MKPLKKIKQHKGKPANKQEVPLGLVLRHFLYSVKEKI